ncbi:MAG: DUF202 domain-containing protein [Nostocoides sp.]
MTEGLQAERTALAWQRTGLSLIGAALVMARLAFDSLGALAVVGAATSIALSGAVLHAKMGHRARRTGVVDGVLGGGRAAACITASVVLMTTIEAAALIIKG